MGVFPDIGLNPSLFVTLSNRYWDSPANQKKFFLDLARLRNFDPSLAQKWYPLSATYVMGQKGGTSVLNRYNWSIGSALVTLFPDIGLDRKKFERPAKVPVLRSERIRQFMNRIAKKKGIDALESENWYNVATDDIAAEKEGRWLLGQFGGSFKRAIMSVFPNLNAVQFTDMRRNFWTYARNRRAFFDELARKHGFDPHVPENWYSLGKDIVLEDKRALSILDFYSQSLSKALIDVYPDIDLEISKFWQFAAKRKFFDNLAQRLNFDPLKKENWYPVKKLTILREKNGKWILQSHSGSLAKALTNVYLFKDLCDSDFATPTKKTNTTPSQIFFDAYASKHGFDSSVPDNWYSVIASDILRKKRGQRVLNRYGGSLTKALLHTYPQIGLDETKFVL